MAPEARTVTAEQDREHVEQIIEWRRKQDL